MERLEDNFGEIVESYIKPVYNFVYRLVGNAEMAEDITQETFIKVWKKFNTYDKDKNFKTWLFAIARNTTIDWQRKKNDIKFSELDSFANNEDGRFEETIIDIEPLPEEVFQRKELVHELEEAMSELRADYREIIFLHNTLDLTFEEIAEVVSKPMNTVKSHYRRALHQIRAHLRI